MVHVIRTSPRSLLGSMICLQVEASSPAVDTSGDVHSCWHDCAAATAVASLQAATAATKTGSPV
jgi:hypothetical protein